MITSNCCWSSAITSARCACRTATASCRRWRTQLGITSVRFPYNYPKLPVDLSHPRYVLDHNRCILCTRCVRVCAELEGAHVWEIIARGIHRAWCSDLNQKWGESRDVHQLRQVRAGVSDGRAGGEGQGGGGDGQARNANIGRWRTRKRSRGMKQVKVATVWLDGCSGCHMSLLDLDATIIALARRIDIVYGPLVDAQEFPEDVDVTLVEGAVSSQEDRGAVQKIRQRTKILIALGDCAVNEQCAGDAECDSGEPVAAEASSGRPTNRGVPANGVPPLLKQARPRA